MHNALMHNNILYIFVSYFIYFITYFIIVRILFSHNAPKNIFFHYNADKKFAFIASITSALSIMTKHFI